MSRLFELHDQHGSRHLAEGDLPLVFGTGDEAHLALFSGEPAEAYLGSSGGYLFLQPAPGSSRIFHNNENVTASVWIKSGDTTRIGENLIQYAIAGDRVEIRLVRATADASLPPPGEPHPESTHPGSSLPRVAEDKKIHPGRSRALKVIGALLLFLLLAAGFILAGHPLEITVTPQPDSLSVSGFPPAIKIGRHYLGLKGDYHVTADKKGYRELNAEVAITGQAADRYQFSLVKMDGRVDISTKPVAGAQVLLDGKPIGKTPLNRARIAPGEHRLLLSRERYLDFQTTIDVTGMGREQKFAFELAPAWSMVTLNSEPPGAKVLIGGTEKGLTPLTLELLTGNYTILMQKDAFSPGKLELTVPPGQKISLKPLVLQPAPANISLASNPTGAMVTVDSLYMGTTPLELELTPGIEHSLILSLAGYVNLSRKLTATPAEKRSLELELKPEYGTIFLATVPPEAELSIDGKPHGKATGRLELQTVEHVLEFRAKGYKTVRREITPAKGYSRQLEIRLEPASLPAGAAGHKGAPPDDSNRDMVLMAPATFEMGASRRDPGRRANERLHPVQITRPYYIGTKEVTNREFRRFKPGHSSGTAGGLSLDSDDQPVVNISWEEGARYLNWLSLRDGLEPFYVEKNGAMVPAEPMTTGYRFPFEAEWAYAARYAGGNEGARYPWNGTFPPPPHAGNFADESARTILGVVIQGYNDTFAVTAPVASFPKNPGGLFDMGGNAAEWCHDLYTPYSGLGNSRETDPTGPVSGNHHVVRGSSWRDGSITELRLSYRSYANKGADHIGFRIARYAR